MEFLVFRSRFSDPSRAGERRAPLFTSSPFCFPPVRLSVNSRRMKLGLINSAFQQVGLDTATGLKHVARIGFDCVDVFTEAVGISPKEIALVARTSEIGRASCRERV